ncbi:MAG: BA14K family protein [Rhizobiales bacterium]|nr:BA14K family protein [Hyphomicrobiales bacterium]
MNRFVSTFVAAAVAVTSAATSFVPAQALPRIAPAAITDGQSANIEQVQRWDRRIRRYPRYSRGYSRPRHYAGRNYQGRRYSGNRYYTNNYYYGGGRRYYGGGYNNGIGIGAGIITGLAVGAIVGSQIGGGYGGSSWHEACARKYRSFNWNTGNYLGYDGYWHRCNL